jgi:hypothetical protein
MIVMPSDEKSARYLVLFTPVASRYHRQGVGPRAGETIVKGEPSCWDISEGDLCCWQQ